MFELSVVTPQGALAGAAAVQVDEVTAPGAAGEFGVLPGHIPFISATKAGVLTYRKGGEKTRVAVGPGFVEVDMKGGVVVLVQRAVLGDKIDGDKAAEQQRDLEAKLAGGGVSEADRQRLQDDLAWAKAQQDARRA